MYIFGIVVPDSDETPIGRASAALQMQLPNLFPEYRFEFLGRAEIGPETVEELLFEVLVAALRRTNDEIASDIASPDVLHTIQSAVDKIVAAAKVRNVN